MMEFLGIRKGGTRSLPRPARDLEPVETASGFSPSCTKARSEIGLHVVLLLASAIFLTACGPRETEADRAIGEGILLQSLGAQDPSLDPHLATTLPEGALLSSLLEGLVSPDPQTLEPRPAVAERWDVSEDGLVYTFHLRKSARWSNGDPVTARDFEESLHRALSPELGAPNGYLLHVLRGARAYGKTGKDALGVEVIDEHTLRLTLEEPYPYFLSLLTHFIWLPVHMPSVRAVGSETSRVTRWTTTGEYVGNGPFRLVEHRPQQNVSVTKSETYWDADSVTLNGVDFRAFEGVESEERAFRSGQIHITHALPVSKVAAYQRDEPELLRIAPAFGVYIYRFNTTRPPFDDVRVRRALSATINRGTISEQLLAGVQVPAHSFTPPGVVGYEPPQLAVDDPELGRSLLAESGFDAEGGGRIIEILFNTSENHRLIAEALQEIWRTELGLEVRLANQETGVFFDNRRQLNFDICRGSWFGDFLDPYSFLEIFTSENSNNLTGWKNADYDRLVDQARAETDHEIRNDLFAQAETILLTESPIIPIYVYSTVRLMDPRVRGWHGNLLDQHPHKALYFENTDQ